MLARELRDTGQLLRGCDAVAIPLAEELSALLVEDRMRVRRWFVRCLLALTVEMHGRAQVLLEFREFSRHHCICADRARRDAHAALERLVVAAEENDIARVRVEVELRVRGVTASRAGAICGADVANRRNVMR